MIFFGYSFFLFFWPKINTMYEFMTKIDRVIKPLQSLGVFRGKKKYFVAANSFLPTMYGHEGKWQVGNLLKMTY